MELPILIAVGAIAGATVAIFTALQRRKASAEEASAYLKGFRYILSDEPDAAIAELTRAAGDARSVETYFALGALFRRTGEHERAIRLHQNMLLKPGFEEPLRQQIQLELGLDFQRAGMLDEAVVTLEKLLDVEPFRKEAMLRLREIREERLEFAQAAELQGRLVEEGAGTRQVLAHLLAEAALAEADRELAAGFAKRAVEVDPSSGHAAFALGRILLAAGRSEEAAASLRRACELDVELSPRVCESLTQASGAGPVVGFFEERIAREDHPALRVALAAALKAAGRDEAGLVHLRRAVEQQPRGVEARILLGRALLETSMDEGTRRELESLLGALGQQEQGFRCKACGHGYTEPQFRCSGCRAWDTVERAREPLGK